MHIERKHEIFQGDESRDCATGKQSRVTTRKHVIVGVTCAVVIAMVITGVLVGVKFHLDSTSEIVTVYVRYNICFNFLRRTDPDAFALDIDQYICLCNKFVTSDFKTTLRLCA